MPQIGNATPGTPDHVLDEALRVVLVDDHALFRRGMRELLATNGLELVGEAGTGAAGVRLALELAPDVVIMDLRMPGISGIEATRLLLESAPASRVLVVTASAEEDDVLDAPLAGACGYVLKDAAIDEIVAAIRAAAVGESFISPHVAVRLVHRLRSDHEARTRLSKPDDRMTKRELDVLRLLALGYENNEIADALFLSAATVKRHVSAILDKLGLHNRIQAAVYAVRHDLT